MMMIQHQKRHWTFLIVCLLIPMLSATALAQQKETRLVASKPQIQFYTADWQGDRLADGRPDVDQKWLDRLKNIRVEDAWQYLYEKGYKNQYEGDWKMIYSDRPIVGRAMTAQYMPARSDVKNRLEQEGIEAGYKGPMNTWPIEELKKGDVYLADHFGKIAQGTLIGSNLGSSIYAKTGTGVIFNGSLRDLEDLEKIDGFNAFTRGWHPSFLEESMLMGINVPIRIGGVAVMPGDIILAKRTGIVFIPPQFVKPIVLTAEIVALRDEFAQSRVKQGVYTAGQVDTRWTPEMEEDFMSWVKKNHSDNLPVPLKEMQRFLEERTW